MFLLAFGFMAFILHLPVYVQEEPDGRCSVGFGAVLKDRWEAVGRCLAQVFRSQSSGGERVGDMLASGRWSSGF